jgi:hypothetical protein
MAKGEKENNIAFTKNEQAFLRRLVQFADNHKTASLSANIIAQMGYTSVPAELEQVLKKLSL